MAVPTRRVLNPIFGEPVLVAANSGRVAWTKNASLGQFQKGTGWQAELYGGAQSGDDWAACYIPVNELRLDELTSALWSWYQTATETMGLGMVIWIHDPEDFDKRAEMTQLANVAGLDKSAGWNSHELDITTDQFFFYGENTTGTDLSDGATNLYGLDDFQADALFKNWVIYRISFDWGWEASGTFEATYLTEVKINGTYIPIRPDKTELDQIKSSGVVTSDTSIKSTPGKVYWLTISDTAACVMELNDSTNDSGTDVWKVTIPADGYAHFIFQPPLEFQTGIFLDVSTGAGDIIVGYL